MDNPITLPRSEDTVLLKQDPYTSDVDLLRETMNKLFDEEDSFTQRVREVVIGSQSRRQFEDNVEPDDDGVMDILGSHLDSDDLESMLRNLKQLQTFTWCINMPIPPNILAFLEQEHPELLLRYFKMQKTDDANMVPRLDFNSYSNFPQRQYFDRNDFGSLVFTTTNKPNDTRSLRLHLLVPYYPAHEGDAKVDWMTKKTAVATSAIEAIEEGLHSIYATDYHGDLELLVSAIAQHGPTLRTLKLHTLPGFEYDRPKGPSYISPDDIRTLATQLTQLTHLEVDFRPFEPDALQMEMPFLTPNAILTTLASFASLRTLRLWIEVPTTASMFQDAYGPSSERPPLKEDKLVQAVGNIYALLTRANPHLQLELLEVAFTRLDSWDRQDSYPRFLPVKLNPSRASGHVDEQKDRDVGGFTVDVGEWQDDYPEDDIVKFIDYAVGTIY